MSKRVYFSTTTEAAADMDEMAAKLGMTRAALAALAANIGLRWLRLVSAPETMFTPELLAAMKQGGVFDED